MGGLWLILVCDEGEDFLHHLHEPHDRIARIVYSLNSVRRRATETDGDDKYTYSNSSENAGTCHMPSKLIFESAS
jgi:hypothetical protein